MKKSTKKILIALGFDESPEAVLGKAISVADQIKAKIFIIHVISELPKLDFYFDTYRLWEDFRDSAVKESLEILKSYVAKYQNEYPDMEALVEVGEPAAKVLEKADELEVDLIIMGHHVRKGLNHMLHLNTCEHVVRFSKKPVLTFYIESDSV